MSTPPIRIWLFHRGSKDYVYPLEQRAATLWYHDHRMDFTGPQVWRGLAGFHIVHDDEEDALPLPKGEKDVPLMICDRSFGEGGSFLYPSLDPSLQGKPGVKATTWTGSSETPSSSTAFPGPSWRSPTPSTASGSSMPRTPAATGSRSILSPPPVSLSCRWAATGGCLGLPSPTARSPSPQAERFDVVIDFSKYPVGTKVTLKNHLGYGTHLTGYALPRRP